MHRLHELFDVRWLIRPLTFCTAHWNTAYCCRRFLLFVISEFESVPVRHTDRQTDGRTDGRTEGRTDEEHTYGHVQNQWWASTWLALLPTRAGSSSRQRPTIQRFPHQTGDLVRVCFTACNFRSTDQIGTKFDTNSSQCIPNTVVIYVNQRWKIKWHRLAKWQNSYFPGVLFSSTLL